MRLLKISILLFVIIFAVLGVAKGSFALDWNEALSLSQKNSNQLNSARKQLDSYEWTYKRAYSAFLPQLSSSLSMSETGAATNSATSKNYSYRLSATQQLFKGLDNYYNLQSAYKDYEYYKANLKKVEADVFYETRQVFTELLVAQENFKLLDKILERRKENTRLIELRYESGKEDVGNLKLTRANQKEAEGSLSSAKRKLELVRLKLSQLLGFEVSSVEGALAVRVPNAVDFESLVKDAPSYLMAGYQLQSAEIAQKSTISGFLPSVSLSGSLSKSGSSWPPGSESKSWSLSASYSLFPGGSNIADQIIYGIRLDKARQDFEKTNKEIRYAIEEAYKNLMDALETLEVRKTLLDATSERAEISQAKYANGLIAYDEWGRIEDGYISAQINLLSSQKTAMLAEASWYKSYGRYVK